jgi:hypothetical protein
LKRITDPPRNPQKRARTENSTSHDHKQPSEGTTDPFSNSLIYDLEVDVRKEVPDISDKPTVKQLLDLMTDFDEHIMGVLDRCKLSTLDSMTPEICSMWEQSIVSQPRILKAEQC